MGEDAADRTVLHHLAAPKNGDLVAQHANHRQVMADEDDRETKLGAQLLQQHQDMRLGGDVEAGDDLIGDDEVRLQRQSPRDAGALALATGELVRIAVDERRRQTDEIEQRGGTVAAITPALQPAIDLELARQGHRQRQARIERRLRILEDHLDPRAQRAQRSFRQVADLGAVELDAARRRLQQPHQKPPERGLARAGFAHETEHRAARHREIDRFDDVTHHGLAERRCRSRRIGEAELAGAEQDVAHAGLVAVS